MNIELIATAQQVSEEQVKNKTVVVIDVLRATSVMVSALNKGAKGIIPVLTPQEAFAVKEKLGDEVLLGGERHAEPIEGFDYGNSPLSYSNEVVQNKVLVMTTTNGTLAINNSLSARELLVASFANDQAVAEHIQSHTDVVLVCSGNNGLYTLEDALCAGRIIHLLQKKSASLTLSDFALSIQLLYESSQAQLKEVASKGYHYGVLQGKGYEKDLDYCFKSNTCTNIPVWTGEMLVNK
ncbi:2-phosphosulfolactate phosphatase [Carboxylicivirga sp. M1479]|uniref:2-phosphosulfolactate phosphatase n=1 Tax=Carboxylicivirga sp. M1479 TaxID=2594476 RepID=UPI001177C12C|nr:2-phosphosulfolactate phosphatase [Carboxylicivirga sp. M1479]TRX65803.1 2-phosphosulfolactate phosphatase [Carboxylicivirga sp. M1479]